ncbi:peptide deformylase [Guggenheimella bovis]
MATFQIRKDDDPILRKMSKEIVNFDSKLKELADDMLETMYQSEGVGLAAVQIGKLRKLIVVDEYKGDGPMVLVNPSITEESGEQVSQEACLSVTDTFGKVIRPDRITVNYQDLDGNPKTIEAEGNLARILCHEIDHLSGILFIDKAVSIDEEDDDDDYEDDEE